MKSGLVTNSSSGGKSSGSMLDNPLRLNTLIAAATAIAGLVMIIVIFNTVHNAVTGSEGVKSALLLWEDAIEGQGQFVEIPGSNARISAGRLISLVIVFVGCVFLVSIALRLMNSGIRNLMTCIKERQKINDSEIEILDDDDPAVKSSTRHRHSV